MSRKTDKRARTDAHFERRFQAKLARSLNSGWAPTEAQILTFREVFAKSLTPREPSILDTAIAAALSEVFS